MQGENEKLHNELNNVPLSGNDWHPKSVEEAMTHMSHHMDKNCGDKPREGIQPLQQKTLECWLFQEEGHKVHECLNQEKEIEQLKSKLTEARVKWSNSGK